MSIHRAQSPRRDAAAGTAKEGDQLHAFSSPLRFWGFLAGLVVTVVGVLLHLPHVDMLIHSSDSETMSMWSPLMLIGMLLLVVGVVIVAVSLLWGRSTRGSVPGVSLNGIEHHKIKPLFWVTCFVLTFALVIDIMKPLTTGFVLSGMSEEYGIPLSSVSVLPIVALSGTAVGSVMWGILGDRFGRRPTFILSTVLFIATAACGAMPSFSWNVAMCFVMGISAGGLLPLTFTLVTELAPMRQRGAIVVTVGAIGGVGGYLAASAAAHFLEPAFTWRSLWLIGFPTGLVLLAMVKLIPESPLFLLRHGRRRQAEEILERYGAHLDTPVMDPLAIPTSQTNTPIEDDLPSSIRTLLKRYPLLTTVLGVVGLAWGLVQFGFLVMLPSQLHAAGAEGDAITSLLTSSALYSIPVLAVVVLLYSRWSARRTLILFITIIGLAVGAIAMWSTDQTLLVAATGSLVLALAAVNAMLVPYSAELYPTSLRATGSGFAAAATKVGGVIGPAFMLVLLKYTDGLRVPGLILAALTLVTAALMMRHGREIAPLR